MQTYFFPPRNLKIRQKGNALFLKMDGQKIEISPPKRALPLSNPDEYILINSATGDELGFIRKISELDEKSRDTLRDALEEAYRVTKIIKVLSVDREPISGQISWSVEIENTEDDDGMSSREITFSIAGAEDVQTARYPQIFFTDVEGNRYEIDNCEAMDLGSRRASERYF
jgi:hypothetical protein